MEKAEASRISRAVSWQCPAFPLELRCLLGAQSLRTGMRLCQEQPIWRRIQSLPVSQSHGGGV
jgi:hypothetical protein